MLRVSSFVLGILFAINVGEVAQAEPNGKWVWSPDASSRLATLYFRQTFEVTADDHRKFRYGRLFACCDREATVYLNGRRIAYTHGRAEPGEVSFREPLQRGTNVIGVVVEHAGREDHATSDGADSAGLLVRLEVLLQDRPKLAVSTDRTWHVSAHAPDGWLQAGDVSGFAAVQELEGGHIPDDGQIGRWERSELPSIQAPKGFQVERVYSVPRDTQGSWVSLTVDGRGRLIASDQRDRGLFRVSPSAWGNGERGTVVEPVPVPLSGVQGMTWSEGALYAVRNGEQSGVWKATDDNHDGELDSAMLLLPLKGKGEHGPHAIVPDGRGAGFYILAGNGTELPANLTGSSVTTWNEDLLLPRQWDPRGHAKGRLAPGGWICHINADATQRFLVSTGYRNPYDLALHRDGELFTWDADMEWDFGLPWYRPARLCHAVPGSDFGWRSGSGKWPQYYPDSLPPTVNLGRGSPTGMVFGYGARFPERWQNALYLLDWTFGVIWAVHLQPEGASYRGEPEVFISGEPLPVTDAVIGADGALYFTVGGRNVDSALYRVYYKGAAGIPASIPSPAPGPSERVTRKKLEALQTPGANGAIDEAWPFLASEDRFLRHAARVVLEHQPVQSWRGRAVSEENAQALATALVALARRGTPDDQRAVITALQRVDPEQIPPIQYMQLLRACELALLRAGELNGNERDPLLRWLEPHFPAEDRSVHRELLQLLVYLDSPTIVEKALPGLVSPREEPLPDWAGWRILHPKYRAAVDLLLNDMPPQEAIDVAFALRNVQFGWTLDQRKAYFTFLNGLAPTPGGASFPGYLKQIRADALGNCSPQERDALAELIGETFEPVPLHPIVPPRGPGRVWSVAEALSIFEKGQQLRSRNFESGQNLFHAAQCARCHRFNGQGGGIGPDLSTVANKFSLGDLLEAVLEPSRVVSDQYRSSHVIMNDGRAWTGLLVEPKDDESGQKIVEIFTSDAGAEPIRLARDDVEQIVESPVSQMPDGLVNGLNADELADLIAFLLSRGDSKAAYFH